MNFRLDAQEKTHTIIVNHNYRKKARKTHNPLMKAWGRLPGLMNSTLEGHIRGCRNARNKLNVSPLMRALMSLGLLSSTSSTSVTHLVQNEKVCYPTGYKECW